jgi:hypothetical protein
MKISTLSAWLTLAAIIAGMFNFTVALILWAMSLIVFFFPAWRQPLWQVWLHIMIIISLALVIPLPLLPIPPLVQLGLVSTLWGLLSLLSSVWYVQSMPKT